MFTVSIHVFLYVGYLVIHKLKLEAKKMHYLHTAIKHFKKTSIELNKHVSQKTGSPLLDSCCAFNAMDNKKG